MACAGAGAAAFALGPFGVVLAGGALLTGLYIHHKAQRGYVRNRISLQQQQQNGDKDSSEVAEYLNLGYVGEYRHVLNDKRDFSYGEDGDKGYVEADHIPPLQSLREARNQPEFASLRFVNPRLYELVQSLRDDPRGMNQLTVQVLRHHHRDALSTGRSRASTAARLLLARRIARGEVTKMLKQAFIIAHPYASQQIRDDAAMGNKTPRRKVVISKDRTMSIYRNAFLQLLQLYFKMGIITSTELTHLTNYVENHGYLDRDSEEYQEILQIVKNFG